MSGSNHPAQGAPYGVKMDISGNFSGYAYSQSMQWINFSGVYASLLIVIPPTKNCKTDRYIGVCADVKGVPDGYTIPVGLAKYIDMGYNMPNLGRIADGNDKFTLQLYFKNKDNVFIPKSDFVGTEGMDPPVGPKYEVTVTFNWDDTLKRIQVVGASTDGSSSYSPVETTLNNEKTPITKGGGVLSKPVLLSNKTLSDPSYESILATNKTWTPAASPNILNLDIKSVAPTTSANLSDVVKYKSVHKTVTNDKSPENNHLLLPKIKWTLKDKTVVPNRIYTGETDLGSKGVFEFFPALSVTTLNTTNNPDNQDVIVAYRNIPVGVEVKGENFGVTTGSLVNPNDTKNPPKVDFNVVYDNTEGFDFGFDGNTVEDVKIKDSIKDIDSIHIHRLFQKIFSTTWTPKLIAELSKDSTQLPEAYTSGAKLETKISYEVLQFVNGKSTYLPINYSSNFLPRLTESNIANPVAVIKGQIYGEAYTPQAGTNTTGIGDKNINIVKDTIYENIQKLIRNQTLPNHKDGTATLSNFTTDCVNSCKKISSNDDEDILYVNADKVVLENGGADITWPKNTVLIVNSGNLFINDNLYNGKTNDKSLGIVVIRNTDDDIGTAGNIYISKNVTNIQAFAVTWGVAFSYDGNYAGAVIDADTGEFTWGTDIPSALNKQLLWQGGISSYNTIGGTENKSKDYYLTGYGILPKGTDKDEDNRKKAQLYDLNYLRYFQLQVQYDSADNPIDKQCGKGLTSEEITAIEGGGTVLGPDLCPPPTGAKCKCNGIDPLKAYKAGDPESGDLASGNDTLKAKDGGDDRTSPVYIEFVKPNPKSLIFSKEKSLTF